MLAYIKLASGIVLETDTLEAWPEATRLSDKDGKAALLQESRETLQEAFPRGSRVWLVLRHVNREGSSRRISIYAIPEGMGPDDRPRNLSAHVGRVLGWRVNREELSVRAIGGGMDMGWHTVECLSRALYGEGRALRAEWL